MPLIDPVAFAWAACNPGTPAPAILNCGPATAEEAEPAESEPLSRKGIPIGSYHKRGSCPPLLKMGNRSSHGSSAADREL
jgi:hypothetical protein